MDLLQLQVRPEALAGWLALLPCGVGLRATVGRGLEDVLLDDAGIDPPTLSSEVRTVFLNGRPVDDLAMARVEDGATVALGAAMPGLVGIVLRRDSPVGLLRADLTDAGCQAAPAPAPGTIVLKLFNILAQRIGPGLLTRGVLLPASRVAHVLSDAPDQLLDAQWREAHLPLAELPQWLARQGESPVLLRITC